MRERLSIFSFPHAYNIPGSAEIAKDAVQEVRLNYLSASRTASKLFKQESDNQ